MRAYELAKMLLDNPTAKVGMQIGQKRFHIGGISTTEWNPDTDPVSLMTSEQYGRFLLITPKEGEECDDDQA